MIRVPKVLLELKHENDVYEFYKAYAKEVGFGIRKSKGHKEHVIQIKRTIQRFHFRHHTSLRQPMDSRNSAKVPEPISPTVVHSPHSTGPANLLAHPCPSVFLPV
ncbi:hypothetical protein LIER_07172 [Lithospermum erythrorhizon]|uniref:FAR1 domain-containing protein n=1 Tax=Lithospermum erythrorhizon TaxID=34254 RepID=A0AAV3P7K9_LITER